MFKEAVGFEIMQALGVPVLLHDDKLTLRAQKRTVSGALNIKKDFYKSMRRNDLLSYWNPSTGEHVKPNEYDPEKHQGWIECWEWVRQLGDNVFVFASYNQIDLKLANLWENFQERYRLALEAAFAAMQGGIIPYRPRAYTEDERNAWEAVRNRLKRNFVISEYETNFLLNPALTEIIENEAKLFQDTQIERNTMFLKRTNEVTVKIYRPFTREKISPGVLTKWQKGAKIEVTLRRDFFKRAGVQVEDLGEQPEIFLQIKARIGREVKGIMQALSKQTRREIASELGLETYTADSITERMLNVENAMTYIVRELLKHRIELKEQRQELEEQRQEIQNIKKLLNKLLE
jgi:hypothetical protein